MTAPLVDPLRRLFLDLLHDYEPGWPAAAARWPVQDDELSLMSRCDGVGFELSHRLSQRPWLMRVRGDFGELPADARRLPLLQRLLEIQHAAVPFETVLAVSPEDGHVYQSIALPLQRIDVHSLRRAMAKMHALAVEWRRSGFLQAGDGPTRTSKGMEMASAGLVLASVH